MFFSQSPTVLPLDSTVIHGIYLLVHSFTLSVTLAFFSLVPQTTGSGEPKTDSEPLSLGRFEEQCGSWGLAVCDLLKEEVWSASSLVHFYK